MKPAAETALASRDLDSSKEGAGPKTPCHSDMDTTARIDGRNMAALLKSLKSGAGALVAVYTALSERYRGPDHQLFLDGLREEGASPSTPLKRQANKQLPEPIEEARARRARIAGRKLRALYESEPSSKNMAAVRKRREQFSPFYRSHFMDGWHASDEPLPGPIDFFGPPSLLLGSIDPLSQALREGGYE